MCTSLTGLEISCGGEEGMGMSSTAAPQAEIPNGDLPRRYIVDKYSFSVYLLLINSRACHVELVITYSVRLYILVWVGIYISVGGLGDIGLYQQSSMADHMTTL